MQLQNCIVSPFSLAPLHHRLLELVLVNFSALKDEHTDIIDGCKVVLSCR